MSVALEKIPARLRENARFCLTKLEMKPGNVRPDKVPYRTDGTRASPSDPNDFSDFDTVSSIYQKGGMENTNINIMLMVKHIFSIVGDWSRLISYHPAKSHARL